MLQQGWKLFFFYHFQSNTIIKEINNLSKVIVKINNSNTNLGQLCSSKVTIVDNNSNSNIGKINKTSKTLTGKSTSCKWKARKLLEALYQLTTNFYKGEQGEPFVFALLDSTAMLPCLAVVPTQSTLVSCSLPSFYVFKLTKSL